ncbi:hypothetical protein MHYP_G00007930 [Metynnis hypsauchen]
MSELHVRTVRSGSNVTIKCDQNMDNDNKNHLAWYKQNSGKVPEYVVRSFQGLRYASGFNDGRFSVDEEAFDLSIKGTNEEDAGLYFCGKVKANVVEFGSGTRLFYQAEKIHHPVTEMVIKTGESVTLQCSVQSLNLNCSGDHKNNSWIVITLTILNVIFVIVIILLIGVLLKNHRNGTFNSHLSYTDQVIVSIIYINLRHMNTDLS